MNRFASVIIPDAELESYLKDKLTVKPDYGFNTEAASTISSREVEAREIEKKQRESNNKRANHRR